MIGKWESFSDAIEDGDYQLLLRKVRQKLSEDKARELLTELEYDCQVRKEHCKTIVKIILLTGLSMSLEI